VYFYSTIFYNVQLFRKPKKFSLEELNVPKMIIIKNEDPENQTIHETLVFWYSGK
jgi:hypothetical protein